MSAPVPSCPRCRALAGVQDHFCGACGTRLALLELMPERVIVDDKTHEVEVTVVNRGTVKVGVVVRSSDAARCPPWIRGVSEADQAVELNPGEEHRLRLELDPALLDGSEGVLGHHLLPLLTSALDLDPSTGEVKRRVLHVELATAGRPRARPGGLCFRLVPRQRVEAGELVAEQVELRNDGGHDIELRAVRLEDRPRPAAPLNWVKLDATSALVCPPLKAPVPLGPGEVHRQGFAVRLGDEALPPGEVGVFSAALVFELSSKETVEVPIDGVIADGPSLVAEPEAVVLRCQGRPSQARVTVKNPGAVSVTLDSVQVVDEEQDEGSGPAAAWLTPVLVGGDAPRVLPPGGQVELVVQADPSGRSVEHLDAPWGRATLNLQHDGWESEEARALVLPVRAELGRVRILEHAVLGVDFGTSNSSTALLHGASSRHWPLTLEPQAGQEQLASLLFFRGDEQGDGPFLFGRAAENAASLRWANLVRSVKSVIARDPGAVWNFLGSRPGSLVTYRSQELLGAFIGELRQRSETAVRSLPPEVLSELGLEASGVRFQHVVFTHPVGASDEVLAALFSAARRAGLVGGETSFEDFRARRCLDEALAAAVAFTYVIAGGEEDPLSLGDDVKMVAIDVGGGTTDLAAVQLEGLASFRGATRDRVDLTLMASGGDDRFGGDDVDRWLAHRVLDELRGRPEGDALDIEAVGRALAQPSFESFRRAEADRIEATGQSVPEDLDDAAQVAFSAASDLLRVCERGKRALGTDPTVRVTPQVADWPARLPGRAVPAGLRLDVELTQAELARITEPHLERLASRLDPLVEGAGWRWDEVDAVLFTGQGSLLTELRRVLVAHVIARRGAEEGLRVVEPGSLPGFSPKHCVAMGAAVWGDSQAGGGGWLHIGRRSREVLSYSLTMRRGPRFIPVEGLSAGAAFPARGQVVFAAPTDVLTLYRDGKLRWTFRLPAPVREATVVVHDERRAEAGGGGHMVAGERSDDG